jgi:Zn finger protein HypA/HybF involved in hydrogenase expression
MLLINGQKVSEVICLSCLKRWTAARPVETPLINLECPNCHAIGAAIETGETDTAETLLRKAAENENVDCDSGV